MYVRIERRLVNEKLEWGGVVKSHQARWAGMFYRTIGHRPNFESLPCSWDWFDFHTEDCRNWFTKRGLEDFRQDLADAIARISQKWPIRILVRKRAEPKWADDYQVALPGCAGKAAKKIVIHDPVDHAKAEDILNSLLSER